MTSATKSRKSETLPIGKVQLVPWYSIHAFDERNTRIDSWGNPLSDLPEQIRQLKAEGPDGKPETDADRRTTADGLVAKLLNGWDDLQQGCIEGEIPTADEIELAHKQRRARIETWRATEDVTLQRLATYVESVCFPGGKPVEVQLIANMAYRRNRAFPAVAYARHVRHIEGDLVVPVRAMEYGSKLDAYMRHIDENLGKDAGRKLYTPLDLLLIARGILSLGGNEADLRKRSKNVGEAQRACRFIKLHNRFPELRLYERVMLPAPLLSEGEKQYPYKATTADEIGCFIPYTSVNKEHLQALLSDRDPWLSAPIKDRPVVVTTAAGIEAYIERLLKGGNTPPTWSKSDTATIQENPNSAFARFLGWAIANGKRESLDKLFAKYGKQLDESFGKGFNFDDLKVSE